MRRHQAQKQYTLEYDAVVRVQSVARMIVAKKMCQPRLRAITAAAAPENNSVVYNYFFICACGVCVRVYGSARVVCG